MKVHVTTPELLDPDRLVSRAWNEMSRAGLDPDASGGNYHWEARHSGPHHAATGSLVCALDKQFG